jgi:uridylate kinase
VRICGPRTSAADDSRSDEEAIAAYGMPNTHRQWPSSYVHHEEISMTTKAEKRDDGKVSGRFLLKLSGEAFSGGTGLGVDPDVVHAIAREIAAVVRDGSQIAVVIGGGNFFRGAELQQRGMDRARSDYMGMLGTVMNCLALQDFLEKEGIDSRVQTAITMGQVAEPYIPLRAVRHMEKGRVVIFGAGMGMPYFSTDTTAAQRALEIDAEALLMGKNGVDGVYDSDPKTNPEAVKFDSLSYGEVITRDLKVADMTAITLCRDNKLPILVFELRAEGNIARAVKGEKIGTLVGDQGGRD